MAGGASAAYGGDEPDWHAILTEFYQTHKPGNIAAVPALLEKHAGREQELLDSLRSKYQARTSLASIVPTRRRGAAAGGGGAGGIRFSDPVVSNTSTPATAAGTPAILTIDPPDGAGGGGGLGAGSPAGGGQRKWLELGAGSPAHGTASVMGASPTGGHVPAAQRSDRPLFPKQETVNHLIYLHLRNMGLVESAGLFLKEEDVASETGTGQLLAKAGGSPLQSLFGHKATTDAVIDQLLADTPSKLTASAHHFFDKDTMNHLVQMAMQPMWSVHHSKVLLKTGSEPVNIARCGTIRAASLNQLIERITKVIHQPHVSQARQQRQLDSQFVQSFLRTYKHFCAPHTLLAKLFQRWFVPMGLPFTDTYSNYYIMIYASRSSKTSAKYWDAVNLKIKLKVSGILLDWIREFPEDWDEMMIHCLEVFIDDNYYTPTPGLPNVCTEFLQYSEALKVALKEVVTSRERAQEAEEEVDEIDAAHGLSLLSHQLTATDLATQLTAADHELLRRIKVRELLDYTKNEMHFLNLQATSSAKFTAPPTGGGAQIHYSLSGNGGGGSNNGSGGVSLSASHSNLLAAHQQYSSQYGGIKSPQAVRSLPSGGIDALAGERAAMNPADSGKAAWARYINHYFQRSQDIQKWVVMEVLSPVSDRERALVVAKFVETAYKCLEMNNFQTCQSIVYAFNHPSIQRMRRFLHSAALQDSRQSMTALRGVFCSPTSNTAIKKLMKGVEDQDINPPIPCLGVWVSDLQLIDEAQPTVLLDNGVGLIHWRKYQAVSTIFTGFATVQSLVV